MKITIYELLGLVKDGEAPKKIRYDDTIYEYSEIDDFYYCNGFSLYREFATNGNCLDKEVEIIEESKKIEKLYLNYKDIIYGTNFKEQILNYCDNLQYKINELIDEINKLKEND